MVVAYRSRERLIQAQCIQLYFKAYSIHVDGHKAWPGGRPARTTSSSQRAPRPSTANPVND